MDKPNCYECEHRGTIPGSAHTRCCHPAIGKIDPMAELMGIFASVGRVAPIQVNPDKLNIRGNAHGIRNGWFNWPMNFDPTWLEQCDGFQAKAPPPREEE